MDERTKTGLTAHKPASIWKRPIEIDSKILIGSIAKCSASAATSNWVAAAEAISKLPNVAKIKEDPGASAWLLIFRSCAKALHELVGEHATEITVASTTAPEIETIPIVLDQNFFNNPQSLPVVASIQFVLEGWLAQSGVTRPRCKVIAERFPAYFTYALHNEWKANVKEYSIIETAFESPFIEALKREQEWYLYRS